MNPWIDSANDWLLRTPLVGSVLILTVLGLSWMLGRHLGPRWRVLLWTLVGLKLLVPAFVAGTPGIGNWFRADTVNGRAVDRGEVVEVLEIDPFELGEVLDPFGAETAVAAPVAASVPALDTILVSLWLAGALLFLGALVWRQRRFLRRAGLRPCRDARLLALVREVCRSLGMRLDFRVLSGPEGATPAVFGFWGANLVLPRDWERRFEPEALRFILMHEIEHIRHRDVFLNWIAAAVNALHWFNPLVWIAVSRFQSDRELRCDANTLARLRPGERIGYGRTLLRVQREFLPAPAIAGLAPCVRNHPTLQQRIQMITNPTQRKRWLNAILVPGVAGLIAISFGSATADEERPSREGERPRDGGPRDGGPRDGERGRESGSGREREGDRPSEGEREGERPREGDRPREGEGDRPREGGPRDGERPMAREGEIRVSIHRDGVRIGDRHVPMVNLRAELDKVHARSAILFAQPDVTFQQVSTVTNALRNSGIHDVRVGGVEGQPGPGRPGEPGRPPFPPGGGPRDGEGGPRPEGGPRDGDRPRPEGGPRDGDRPRPEGGSRDGDRPRPEGGPRDGDRPRPEGGPRDGDRPRPEGGPRDGDRPSPEREQSPEA